LGKVGIGKGYIEENYGGGQGLNWALEPRRERLSHIHTYIHTYIFITFLGSIN
jgi:hypothetical protein